MHASNPLIFNTTILDNSSVLGSGIFINVSNPVLTNSIILDNSSESIFLYSGSEDPIITYSNIEGGWEGEGNIDLDPLLNDDFTLQANSPCIDAGTADLDGDGQNDITDYYGEAPDMGAFEFEGSTMIPGDVTGDGQLNILDVGALVNIVLGNADSIDSGDLNGDGNLNVLDVVALVQIILEG